MILTLTNALSVAVTLYPHRDPHPHNTVEQSRLLTLTNMGSLEGRKPSASQTSGYIPESSVLPPPHHGRKVFGITIHARKDT